MAWQMLSSLLGDASDLHFLPGKKTSSGFLRTEALVKFPAGRHLAVSGNTWRFYRGFEIRFSAILPLSLLLLLLLFWRYQFGSGVPSGQGMGKKLDAILRKGFRSSKCTALLKMLVSRIKLLRNRREIQCRQTRKDIAQLLQNGQLSSARLRVELIFREQNILDAYVLIEQYCHLVIERMVSIENQRTCPNDLKEAVASLIFATARCADLPELQDIRSLFVAKYGNEFSTAAVELRPNCGVNSRVIEKLSTRAPSTEVKVRLLKEIATENGIEWNFEKPEMEILKSAEDLLDGPKHFFSGSHGILKPADAVRQASVPENAKTNTELNKMTSSAVMQSSSVAHSPSISSPIPLPGEGAKSEQQFAYFVNQEHAKIRSTETNDSPPLQAPSVPRKEELVESPQAAKTLETKASKEEDPYIKLRMEGKMDYHASRKSEVSEEEDLYTRLRMEGKMDYHASRKTEVSEEEDPYTRLRMEGKMDYDASRKTRNSTSEVLNPNDYHAFTKFTEIDGASVESTQETLKYASAAAAAQAAFESAALAAEAAKAAVNLAKSEAYNEDSIQSGDDWKDVGSQSELDEALEAALSKPIHVLESDIEETSSPREEDAVGMKISKAIRHERKDFPYPDFHFTRVQSSQKVNMDSESEEEPSEVQISLSKTSASWASNYNQHHVDVFNDIGDKYGPDAVSKGGELQAKHDQVERTQIQSKSSMPCSASDSTDQYSSFSVTDPVFDNYDAEDEDENASSGKISNQSVLDRHRSEHNDSCSWRAPHTANRSRCGGDDEDDQDEMIMSKQYQKQDYISEIERKPNKSSFQLRPRLGRASEGEGKLKDWRSERSCTRLSKPSFDEDEKELEGLSPHRSGTTASKPSLSDDGGKGKATKSQRLAAGTRSSKLSFEDFVRQETHSFEYFNPESDDSAESLNDFGRKKVQDSSGVSIERRAHSEDKYDPLHGRTLRQGIGATMSDDRSTFSAHAIVHKNYRSEQHPESNYSDFQSSDNNDIARSGVAGKAPEYDNMEDQGVFVEGGRPQDSYCSKQLCFDEDNKVFQGLETGDTSHSDGEYSTEIPQNCNVHLHDFGNESKQHFLREDVTSAHSYGGPEPSESCRKDAGIRIDQMGPHKATHRGESRRSWRTQQQPSEQQNNSVNGRPCPPLNKKLNSQSINTGYTPHNNPLTISPEYDSSTFMTQLPPPPVPPIVKTGDNAKEAQKSSKPRPPFEQPSAIPSAALYTNDEFSERLEALRRKR